MILVEHSSQKKILLFILAVGICLLAGYLGSFFTTPEIPAWYATLQKPALTPPSWVFAPVWTLLYLLMGVSLYLVLRHDLREKAVFLGVLLFGAQLFLNICWSFLFFGLHSPLYGLIGIVLLWGFILATILQVRRFSVAAGALLIPYLLWVSFATVLNYSIMILN